MRRTTKGDRWQEVLREVREDFEAWNLPAYSGIVRLMTIHGRLPYREAFEGLTFRERSLVQHLLGRDDLRLTAPDDPGFGACNVVLAFSSLGKLTLHELAREDLPSAEDTFAGLQVPDSLLEKVGEESAIEVALEDQELARFDELLYGWEEDGSLPGRLGQVIDWVERVETVFIYIGRRIFSRSDSGSSTLIKGGVLTGLVGRSCHEWSSEERLFVASTYALFLSGRAIRFEEFNGRQLTATALRQRLLRRCSAYLTALGSAEEGLEALRIDELADKAGSLVDSVDASDYIRYRRISSLTYVKEEFLDFWPKQSRREVKVSSTLADLASQQFGIDPEKDAVELVRALTRRAIGEATPEQTGSLLCDILEAIVGAAARDTAADYAMSSGIRDITRLAGGSSAAMPELMELRKPDFFCCVLPAPAVRGRLAEGDLSDLLWQVAQRMMYNRWHFLAGNFRRSDVPQERHYYFPPVLPDIGENGDLRHGGHLSAQVRYTLRAPSPAPWVEPLTVFGQSYRGSHDIRVVRMEGPPFTLSDMKTACRYSALVDVMWREMGLAASEGRDIGVFSRYDASWYRDVRWLAAADAIAHVEVVV